MDGYHRPLELILARNLLASLSTPAFLVDGKGEIAFYNEAAGLLLGRRYEDTGAMPAEEWGRTFGPFDAEGRPIPFEDLGLTDNLRTNRPAHERLCVKAGDGGLRTIEVSALPIVGGGGYRGAMVAFWPAEDDEDSR